MGGIKQYERHVRLIVGQQGEEPAEPFVRASCNYLNERGDQFQSAENEGVRPGGEVV